MIKKIMKTICLAIGVVLLLMQISCELPREKEKLDRPENLRVVVTDNDAVVFFDPVNNADVYYVYAYEQGDTEAYDKYISTDPIDLITGITLTLPDGTFKFQVQAFDSNEVYAESDCSKSVLASVPGETEQPIIVDEDEYTITYVLNGGTLSNPTTTFKKGSTTILPTPSMDGSDFIGWYLEPNFVNSISVISSLVDYDVIVYAKWSSQSQQKYETYYKNAEGKTGTALKQALRTIISSGVKTMTYNDLKTKLPYTDQDPNDSSKMLLVYSGAQVKAKWDGASTWNREHMWPQSKGWFTTSGAGADIQHIRPEDPIVNSTRGNLAYGICTDGKNLMYNGKSVGKYGKYFEPLDEFKGDVARIVLYLLVRYSESDKYNITAVAQSIQMLLDWNEKDPVSSFEKIRNERSYSVQGNRNPFIDHPEFADMIW